MIPKEVQIATLQGKITKAEQKGNGTAGVVTKWKRQIRNLSKYKVNFPFFFKLVILSRD